jgi:hypothetical protein
MSHGRAAGRRAHDGTRRSSRRRLAGRWASELQGGEGESCVGGVRGDEQGRFWEGIQVGPTRRRRRLGNRHWGGWLGHAGGGVGRGQLCRVGRGAPAQERGEQSTDAHPPSRPKARGKGREGGAGHGWAARQTAPPEEGGEKGAWGFSIFPFCSNSSPKCTFHKFTQP